jgi:UDP-glucose 4-epimerase
VLPATAASRKLEAALVPSDSEKARARVLVTGANGFIGRFVLARLRELGAEPIAGVRGEPDPALGACARLSSNDSIEEMAGKLVGVDAVVHLAAVVHDMRGAVDESTVLAVNLDWTRRLAEAASSAGVRHFVFCSTIKVNGESTPENQAFREDSPVAPVGPYARSKYAAEQALAALAEKSRLAVSVLRPSLVYGPGVRANFYNLLRAVSLGVPLPFGGVRNARSFIYVENFADVLARVALAQPPARARTLLLSDGEDLSTAELIRRSAAALGRRPRLLHVPESWLLQGAKLAKKQAAASRLLGSLRVDSSRARAELGWTPPFSFDEGLSRTARWFRRAER